MTTAPQYDPNTLFTTVRTYEERECSFCTEPIDPATNFSHYRVSIPTKTVFVTHETCFEQLAWSMLNYVVKSLKRHEVEVVH